ncbi:hypothetical protein BEH94_02790 [Candidatus Altiarchaeales archaeon WOR_SM1_SCG]|nr:hypothetical protein BEH94_02790 [Candidatus Altiarchaeales archaeon WOR_SM1_SCG]
MKKEKKHLFFVDNLRILLIVLVILHHLAITYGGPGMWYYQESSPGMIESLVFALFLAMNQSFFMGFFFMISGYFTPGSYDRKGAWRFFKDRLLRLGIPLLFYIIFIDIVINYATAISRGFSGSFLEFLGLHIEGYAGLGTGPLWFVESLLIFAAIYVLWRLLSKSTYKVGRMPNNKEIVIFALFLAIFTFIVRIWLPLGWNFELLNLQIPFFPQYIVLFIVGLIAYRGKWFSQIPAKTGKLWLRVAIVLAILLPIMLVLGAPDGDPSVFFGGVSWQAFAYPLWEQFFAVSIIIALSVLFRERYNHQGRLAKELSASAYTVYILHAPIIVFLALSLKGIALNPLLKFVLVAPVAVFLCFLIGNYIRKLPLARRIL